VTDSASEKPADEVRKHKRRRITRRSIGLALLILLGITLIARAFAPQVVTWYVNRTINRSIQYTGSIDDIDLSLWRGAYQIKHVRLLKKTGNTPAPLFECQEIDLAVDWSALLGGRVVGVVRVQQPQVNFVDGPSDSGDQTGAGGPWLGIIQDLFPFEINRAELVNGSVHFRAPDAQPPVDVYIHSLNATVSNLRNIQDEIDPLLAKISATGQVMGHAPFELDVQFDPFSYYPTFALAMRVVGLRVRELNDLAKAYGGVDFEAGYFDMVLAADCTEGRLEGYVKPLFRNLKVLDIPKDMTEDNVLEFFWEAIVGVTTNVLQNQPRDQFGTRIPFTGTLQSPEPDLVVSIGNVLRNAFIRAYLPRLDHAVISGNQIQFEPGVLSHVGIETTR
jgi:hypothetical protein